MTAEEILALRKRLKMSQDAMAKKLRVSRQTINNWESGRKKPSRLARAQLARLERKNG